MKSLLPPFLIILPLTLSTNTTTTPQPPNLPQGFHLDIDSVSLTTGHFHTCAITPSATTTTSQIIGGPIKCWGLNNRNQATPPVGGTYVQISAGLFATCAVALDESIRCWGDDGVVTASEDDTTLRDMSFLQVSVGESHACGVKKDGGISCWGRNDFGEGDPPTGTFVQVSAGQGHTCAIRPTGRITCWGKNSDKQSTPPHDHIDTAFRQISASMSQHVCAITIDYDVVCWGNNSRNQAPTFRPGPYVQVSTGNRYSCGIKMDDGSVDCWGGRRFPVDEDEGKRREWEQLALGHDHACAVDVEGLVSCWFTGADLGGSDVPLGFVAA
eukprot:CAMPEP_0172481926 /NCGR_PEP_ID=MMETSP1066-20121228/8123_1 /TAXON_ID=671091 /ORGANISM="Coscinodiscus wailesii, Strain CCMP2513" /LENGTH=326 /DNA_ID=CAMNT_0013244669 /DNA_START=45 /DNA_END=1025 /DNA_ORIENTATION=+